MAEGLLGRKVGMTQIFAEDGRTVPVTVIEVGPCVVLEVKSKDKHGYASIQIGFDDRTRHAANNPSVGIAKKANCEPKIFIREVACDGKEYTRGQVLSVKDVFEGVSAVDVIGRTKGKGFQGVIKRHNFNSGPRAHGSKNAREVKSVGCRTPSRIIKLMRMPGQMGNVRATKRNLTVAEIDAENNLLLVRGSIPGSRNGYVLVRKTNKK